MGLLRTPEIELSDLKVVRNNNNLNGSFSSRNSSESACSSEKKVKKKKKKKKGLFDRNGGIFGGCKCSVNAVETVNLRIGISVKKMGEKEEEEKENLMKKKKKKEKSVSLHNRTFEWLKQLSLEGGGGGGGGGGGPHEV